MAAALPAINTDEIASRHQPQLSKFDTWRGDLDAVIKEEGITRDTANDAQELDTAAKRWLDGFDAETKPIRVSLDKAHDTFIAFCKKMSGGATAARAFARKVIGDYQLEEDRIANEKRRAAEMEALRLARALQQAEVDARLAEAAAAKRAGDSALAKSMAQDAEKLKAAPLIPIIVPEVAPAKVEGSSVSFKLVGTVVDHLALLKFLLEGDPKLCDELILWSQSGINAALKRGLTLPGVSVEKQAVVRNMER
jgi:hypothetical protein